MPPRPCLYPGCPRLAPGTYCQEHERQRQRAKVARRQAAPGDGARQRLRRRLNRQGAGTCALCGTIYPAPLLQVDHKVRLRDGGADVDANLQVLCIPHHRAKTTREGRGESSWQATL